MHSFLLFVFLFFHCINRNILFVCSCVKNCISKINVAEKVALMASCVNCDPGVPMFYTWTMTPGSHNNKTTLDFKTEVSYSANQSVLIVKEGVLSQGDMYTFSVVGENFIHFT